MPTAPFGDADIQAVIDGVGGVSVTVGAVTANGKLRATDDRLEVRDPGGRLGARQISVMVRTATFAGLLSQGTAITVDGTAYKITEVEQLGTALMTRVYCAP